ncbi:finger MYM-type 1-like [Octopus vulgaris]|uniref:Finger MYM-type 1-like n=1 Tax=Octopus vulgaris TaxID=6645 RepID=A0AA36BW60_OCTVU|nr:finger MYM-type 1-like [Octopus vulgaris]
MPDVSLTSKAKNCIRKFSKVQYEKTKWLAACSGFNKFYCWPCLLFNNERGTWNSYGFSDLNNLHKAIKRHELSSSHLTSVINLTRFGKTRTDFLLNSQHRKNIETHNEKVKKNREILRRLIDVVCFLSEQQLAFRDHEESADPDNEGNYVEILHLCKKYDPILSNLQEAGIFSDTSNRFQNDLINSVAEVLLEKIKSEINDSTFVAIILDEASEIRTGAQLSFVVRYVLSDGNIAERFLGFLNVGSDRTASGLSKIVFDKIEELKIGHKFVAQTYDGASVMSSELNGLQKKVKEKYPNAFFVHCMAHRLNLVLSQAAANIQECDKFFSQIKSFSLFFCKLTKRVHQFDTEIKRHFPKVAPTDWNLNHSLVETVREYHEKLADLFLNIIDNSSKWDTESYTYAQALYSNLQNCEFNFLLNVFGDIFICTNTAFDILQTKPFDVSYCVHTINEIVKVLKEKKHDFPKFWANVDGIYPQIKKRKTAFETEEERYRQLFYKIIDLICEQIEIRFQNLNELHFLALLDPMRQSNNVQETSLTSLKHSYEDYFDSQKLRSELTALYKDAELKGKSVQDLLCILHNSGLDEALPQLTKLCELILTLPTSATLERSLSYLSRIHNYTRNSQGQEKSSSLALIGIEKAVLKSIKNDSFYNDVINNFNKKQRRIELIFK